MSSSRTKFRSRKLDPKRPLPIHHAADLPGLNDAEISREVPTVATGVEKEEEEEHHLQQVIIAAQVAARETTATAAYIPTPDASQLIDYYEELYSRRFQLPTNLLKFSRTVEEVCGPSYCMDARDVQWLREFNARLAGGRGSGATASASPRAKGKAQASSPSPKNKGKNAMDVDGTNAALAPSPTTSPRKASPRKLDEKTVVPSPKPVDVRASGPPLPLSTSTTWPAEPPLSATSSAIPRPPANQISEEQFESIISILETTTTERQKETPPSVALVSDLAKFLVEDPQSTDTLKSAAPDIYEHWRKRKDACGHDKGVMPVLKLEEAFKGEIDPYTCFRKRDVRTSRKTRRTDGQSLHKLRQLRSELETGRTLMEMVVKREKLRQEALLLDRVLFEQRRLAREINAELGLPAEVVEEAKAQRKRALKLRGIGSPSPSKFARANATRKRKVSTTEPPLDLVPKDPLTLGIESDVQRMRVADGEWEDMTAVSELRFPRHPAYAHIQPDLHVPHAAGAASDMHFPRGRYRYGRGGRLWVDRRPRIDRHAPSMDPRFKYDDFEDDSDIEEFSTMPEMSSVFALRLQLLTDDDLKRLLCIHAPTPPRPRSGSVTSVPATPLTPLSATSSHRSSTSALSKPLLKSASSSTVSVHQPKKKGKPVASASLDASGDTDDVMEVVADGVA